MMMGKSIHQIWVNVSASRETAARDTNLQNQMSEGEAAMARAEATENLANDVLGVLDVRQKHQ